MMLYVRIHVQAYMYMMMCIYNVRVHELTTLYILASMYYPIVTGKQRA